MGKRRTPHLRAGPGLLDTEWSSLEILCNPSGTKEKLPLPRSVGFVNDKGIVRMKRMLSYCISKCLLCKGLTTVSNIPNLSALKKLRYYDIEISDLYLLSTLFFTKLYTNPSRIMKWTPVYAPTSPSFNIQSTFVQSCLICAPSLYTHTHIHIHTCASTHWIILKQIQDIILFYPWEFQGVSLKKQDCFLNIATMPLLSHTHMHPKN